MPKPLWRRSLISLILAVPIVANLQALAPAHADGGQSGQLSPGTLSAAEVQRLAQHANQRVIVLLRDQHPELPARGATAHARVAAVTANQTPILGELAQLGAPGVRSFRLINAIAATVSPAEEARLAANPLVLGVVPDRVIRGPLLRHPLRALHTGAAARPDVAPRAIPAGACPAPGAAPLLEPQALQLTNTAFPATNPPSNTSSAQGLLATAAPQALPGQGVRVAYIADGLDTTIPDFQRSDGSAVFIDYQDFSTDGPGAATAGGEAFGDASSIAAQGLATYDLSLFVDQAVNPLPAKCNIRILGMAPGASLVGLNVFSNLNQTTTSNFVQAIDYAVLNDSVDVINESFGGNPYPDNGLDPISLANQDAVNAGVTVVASTGDAGTANTLGSPATDPFVINAGASTQFHQYSQTASFGITIPGLASGTYLNNNISAFSSAGFSQYGPGTSAKGPVTDSARTVDVVAPGDTGWALCSPALDASQNQIYTDCFDQNGNPASIESFAGTSESAPLVSGCVADVIQGYRLTHNGASPTPAQIKQIVMSSATDLGIPANEQGAGLLNCFKAVQVAMSVHDANGSPTAPTNDNGLLFSPSSLSAADAPNTPETFTVNVTNPEKHPEVIFPHLRTLSTTAIASGSVQVALGTAPTFVDGSGFYGFDPGSYATQTFTVPIGAQRLDASINWPLLSGATSFVALTLFDPLGELAAFSSPLNFSQFGHVDVKNPPAGSWTALIWNPGNLAPFTGNVQFSWSASRFVPPVGGSFSPSFALLQPGASTSFTVHLSTPATPGDVSDALTFTTGSSGTFGQVNQPNSMPIALRAVPAISSTGGTFSGVLTGGIGRGGAPGQSLTYPLNIPAGQNTLSISVRFADALYDLEGVLIDPNGQPVDVQTNQVGSAGNTAFLTKALQFFRTKPQGGLWTLVLLINTISSGNQPAEPFTVAVSFPSANGVTAPVIPTTIKAGTSAMVGFKVTNIGALLEQYFVDARQSVTGAVPLVDPAGSDLALPLPLPQQITPTFIVPPGTTELDVQADATQPVSMDVFNLAGAGPNGLTSSPDIMATAQDNTALAVETAPEVAIGPWQAAPSPIGPYPLGGATPGTVNVNAQAITPLFDPSVTSTTGDPWLAAIGAAPALSPLALNPNQSGTITLTITPAGPKGTKVSGVLYVVTFSGITGSGDELQAIPYSYTIG